MSEWLNEKGGHTTAHALWPSCPYVWPCTKIIVKQKEEKKGQIKIFELNWIESVLANLESVLMLYVKSSEEFVEGRNNANFLV